MPNGINVQIPPEFLQLTPEEVARLQQAIREGVQPIPGGEQPTPIVRPGAEGFLDVLRQQRDIVEPIADISALVGTGLSFVPHPAAQIPGRALMMGGGALGALTHGSRAAEALAEGEFGEAGIQGISALFLRGAGKAAKGLKLPKDSLPSQPPFRRPAKPTPIQKAAQQTAVQRGTATAPKTKRLQRPPTQPRPRDVELPPHPEARPAAVTGKAPKFDVAEAEQAGVRAGRRKLGERIRAKGGKAQQVEKGLAGELDRLGVEYRRTVSSLENVQKQLTTAGSPEIAAELGTTLKQLRQARSFIGKELQKGEAKAIEQSLREIGIGSSALLQMMAGGTTGALAGAATAEDEPLDVRVGRAVLGAAAGAFTGGKLAKAVAKPGFVQTTFPARVDPGPGLGTRAAQRASDYQYFSMLASPGPVCRAFLGGVGGWARSITDRMIEGRFKDAAKIAGDIRRVPGRITRALIDPEISAKVAEAGSVPVHKGLLGAPGRVINASDFGWSQAITRGGYSIDEARNFTLSGTPRTKLGQQVMHLASGADSGPVAELAARTVIPFARPQVIAAEQALKPILPQAALAKGAAPLTQAERVSSLVGNIGSGAAGFAAEPFLPAGTESTAAAATGPGQLFFLGGAAARQAVDEGDPLMLALLKAAGTVGGEAATAFTGQGGRFGESLGAERVTGTLGNLAAQRLIPSFLRDIAQSQDPTRGRETGFTRLTEQHGVAPREAIAAPALARLPGARQVLPELSTEVDVRGEPRIDPDRSPLMRGLFPVSRTGTTIAGLSQLEPKIRADDPIAQEFEKQGVPIEPPTLEPFEPAPGVEFKATDPDRLALLKTQREQEFNIYTQVINGPGYQSLPDHLKPQFLQELKSQVSQTVGEALADVEDIAAIRGGPR